MNAFYKRRLEQARASVSAEPDTRFATPDAEQQVERTSAGLMRPRVRPQQESQSMAKGLGMALMSSIRPEARRESGAPSSSPRPEPRYATEFEGTYEPQGDLREDEDFINAIEELADRRGISTSELYKVIQGESGFNPRAQNASGATGLFQFMPATARELGTSIERIKEMSPREQVELYDRYLERWDYNSNNRLGIMQAAPAFANREEDAVIYARGSAAWEQNPGWRERGDGDITVRSINNYYARQG